MKRILLPGLFLVLFSNAALTQLSPISAAEYYPDAFSKAQTSFSADAQRANIFFSSFEYLGVQISMDLSTGKAKGWIYRFYSPSLDSSYYLIAAHAPLLGGKQIVELVAGVTIPTLPVPVLTQFPSPWVDTPQALQGAKDAGAATFI